MKCFKTRKVIALLLVFAITLGVVYNTGVGHKSKADKNVEEHLANEKQESIEHDNLSYEEALDECVQYNYDSKCYELVNEDLITNDVEILVQKEIDFVNNQKDPESIQNMIDSQVVTRTGFKDIHLKWYGVFMSLDGLEASCILDLLKSADSETAFVTGVMALLVGLASQTAGVVAGIIVLLWNHNRGEAISALQKCVKKKKGADVKLNWSGTYTIKMNKKGWMAL